jgi:hypothetical protein
MPADSHLPSKQRVAGSIPVSRSRYDFLDRRTVTFVDAYGSLVSKGALSFHYPGPSVLEAYGLCSASVGHSGCTIRGVEPRVQYAESADGVRIAYAAMGAGDLLITTPTSWESLSFILDDSVGGPLYTEFSRTHRVIRYDRRGTGLSDRDCDELGLEADVRDLEAVVQAAGAD